MPQRDPNAVAANWATRLGQSTQKISDGIDATTVAPGVAAARQADVWAANVAAAKPKWQQRVSAVTLQDWQTAAKTKGVPRIASGAQAAQPKMAAFMAQLLPKVASVVSSLPPRGDVEANIQRSAAFQRAMSQWSYNKGAGA